VLDFDEHQQGGQPPTAGTIGQYRIVAHLDTTRRIMLAPPG
jgi:hypothetical protein